MGTLIKLMVAPTRSWKKMMRESRRPIRINQPIFRVVSAPNAGDVSCQLSVHEMLKNRRSQIEFNRIFKKNRSTSRLRALAAAERALAPA